MRRLLPAVGAGGAVAAGTIVAGWPYLRHECPLATLNILVAGSLTTAGVLLAGSALLRRTGVLLAGAGLAWLTTWTMSWNTGALPLLGIAGSCLFYLLFGTALLLYPDGRFIGRADRAIVVVTAIVLGPLMAWSVLASRPEWNGYAPDVWWPAPLADQRVFGAISDAYLVIDPLLAVALGGLLIRRVRRVRGPERTVAPLVLFAMGVAMAGAALLAPAIEDDDLSRVLGAVASQGAVISVFPLMLAVATGRRALGAATAADRVLRLAAPATVRSVRDALRVVLHDPTVEVHFRLPGGEGYVDVDGQPAESTAPARSSGPRWTCDVRTRDGEPLAVVTGDPALGHHGAFTDAALRAGRLALENAQLQVAVRARLVETRAVHLREADAQAAQRRRMARDLNDGMQRRLAELERAAAAAEGVAAADPVAARTVLRRLHEGLLAANQEVRDLGRGLTPRDGDPAPPACSRPAG
ncbi:histidine kinase [Parafrankia discariae]|uniref:histidine kinase n=1 Tax=Parafrankia discariae TaxID=365528 RepID=UPI00039E5F46|nr:histidine kinase [Parafrankia discariae]